MAPAVQVIDDREQLYAFFASRDPDPYALANLDEPFWPRARWWGLCQGRDIMAAVATVEGVLSMPLLYAVAPAGDAATKRLLNEIAPDLPERVFGLLPLDLLVSGFAAEELGEQRQMVLSQPSLPDPQVVMLEPADQARIQAFLSTAYRDDERDLRVFEPYMLERWPHAALLVGGEIVAFAGTHVLTDRYGAAAVGNIVTRPDQRGRGLAGRLVGSLCDRLSKRGIERIGLNVAEFNRPARRCYERIGFIYGHRFRECVLSRSPEP